MTNCFPNEFSCPIILANFYFSIFLKERRKMSIAPMSWITQKNQYDHLF